MNREARRRMAGSAKARTTAVKWDEGLTDGHLCPTAEKVIELVRADDGNWTIDHERCACGSYTIVLHRIEGLWACLACGKHGELEREILH